MSSAEKTRSRPLLRSCLLLVGIWPTGAPWAAGASPTTKDSATVQRIDASTPHDVQIALATSAGPPVAAAAGVYVLGPKGYELVRPGTNGFVCLVTRERVDTLEPECLDAVGAATMVPVRLFVEQQRARGRDEPSIERAVEAGYASGRFKAPRKPGIVYMLSGSNYVWDPGSARVIHFPGHLMFYAPYATEREIGSGPGAPYLTHAGHADNLLVVIPADSHHHARD